MEGASKSNINQEKEIENSLYKINNILVYIIVIIIINKAIALLKYLIMRRRKKNESKMFKIIKEDKKKKNDNKEIKEIYHIKRNNRINEIKTIIKNYIMITIITFIFLNIFLTIKSNILFEKSHFQYSKITLKIKGTSNKSIFGNSEFSYILYNNIQNVFKLNGIEQNLSNSKFDFDQIDNFVELIFYDNITNCEYMFYECSEITEINLSEFDTSQVTSMYYMFYGCSSLISLDLSNIKTSKFTCMISMFFGCYSLISLDLSYFDTSLIKDMYNMFFNCSSLISLDLSNFNTSKVISMYNMFANCSSLASLNLSSFDTSQVTIMTSMFHYCSSLTSLDLSNFDTSQVTTMNNMFSGCSSLTSLDLSNFNTEKVYSMYYMFNDCSSLSSLNLSNFNTEKVMDMENMFNGCINLEYINLNNFNEIYLGEFKFNYQNMFYNAPDNIIICIKENITQTKIFPQIVNKNCHVIDCTNNWKSKQKKIININQVDVCFNVCGLSLKYPQYKYEYNGKCYENCSKGFLNDDNEHINSNINNTTNIDINNNLNIINNNVTKCKCELDECLVCSNVSLNKGLCTECNYNYYPKENDPFNLGEYIKCYKEPEGYYLDNNLYKQCYYSCKTCNVSGTNEFHNCIECNDNYPFEIKHNNYINCYENCNYYYYFDNEYNFHCTLNYSCTIEYPKLNEITKECKKNDIQDLIENLIINKKNETENMSKEEEIEQYNNIIQIVEKGFTENYDTVKLDKGQEEYIKMEKIVITLTTINNQKNNINYNMTRIDLGECETLLRNEYNISNNETLYMKKIDISQEGMKIPKVEYDVYSKLLGENLIKLNLTVCEKSKISILIPIEITDNIDKLNSSSGYFNDICYITTSEDGTDISLNDRQKDYIDNNKMVCQEDCDFTNYDYITLTAKCSCKVKESSKSFIDMNINKEKLFKNFIKIKNIVNFNFLVCYKNLLNKKSIINNIGSYIIFAIIFIYIITIFIFNIKQFSLLKKKIQFLVNKFRKTNGNKKRIIEMLSKKIN